MLFTKEAMKDTDSLGVFVNSMRLTNYECVLKMEVEKKDDGTDPRLQKASKVIGNIEYEGE